MIPEIKQSESQIKKVILHYLNTQYATFAFMVSSVGIPDFKRKGGFRKSPNRGISDIIGCKKGRFFAMEVKTPAGKVADHQRNFLERVAICEGAAFIVRNLEDAQEAWKEI